MVPTRRLVTEVNLPLVAKLRHSASAGLPLHPAGLTVLGSELLDGCVYENVLPGGESIYDGHNAYFVYVLVA